MPSEHNVDIDAVADAVVERLDPGTVIDDKVVLSRRQLLAIATGTIGLGALGLGSGRATAADGTTDTSVGAIGGAGDSVDVYLDQLYDPGGDEILNVDDTGEINAQFGRTWNFDSVDLQKSSLNLNSLSTGGGTITADDKVIPGAPDTSQSPTYSLGDGWRTPSPDRPVGVLVSAQVATDGTTRGLVKVSVDESGGIYKDYDPVVVEAPFELGSNATDIGTLWFEIPPDAAYRIENAQDPIGTNVIETHREVIQ